MLSSGLEDREKERLLKFFLTKGKLWYNEPEGTYLFSFDERDIKVPEETAQTIIKANDNYLNSILWLI